MAFNEADLQEEQPAQPKEPKKVYIIEIVRVKRHARKEKVWTPMETRAMLAACLKHKEHFKVSPKNKVGINKVLLDLRRDNLIDKGVTYRMCAKRIRALLKAYKAIKHGKRAVGQPRPPIPYEKELIDVFGIRVKRRRVVQMPPTIQEELMEESQEDSQEDDEMDVEIDEEAAARYDQKFKENEKRLEFLTRFLQHLN